MSVHQGWVVISKQRAPFGPVQIGSTVHHAVDCCPRVRHLAGQGRMLPAATAEKALKMRLVPCVFCGVKP